MGCNRIQKLQPHSENCNRIQKTETASENFLLHHATMGCNRIQKTARPHTHELELLHPLLLLGNARSMHA